MQQRPGPIIRPASTRRRRPTRRQIARRRGFATLAVVVGIFAIWQFWPAGGTTAPGHRRAASPSSSSGPSSSATSSSPGVVGPGNPIKHVIFLVKENRTFDTYFGRYPGADGATTGKTMVRDSSGKWVPGGPVVPLKPAPYVQPHDITHG